MKGTIAALTLLLASCGPISIPAARRAGSINRSAGERDCVNPKGVSRAATGAHSGRSRIWSPGSPETVLSEGDRTASQGRGVPR